MLNELRLQLVRYFSGQISLVEFQDWFASASVDLHQAHNSAVQEIMGEILLRLAEFSSGHWSEHDLREKLSSIMPLAEPSATTSNASVAWAFGTGLVPSPSIQVFSIPASPSAEWPPASSNRAKWKQVLIPGVATAA